MSGAGRHRVTYWSVDSVGNVESPHAGYVNIDTTAPVTAATGLAPDSHSGWQNTPQLVSLDASDSLSGVAATYYILDGGATQTYSAPFTISADGQHTVTYWSVDAVGNIEASTTGYVNVDVTSPATTASGLAAGANTGWQNSAQTVSFSAADTQSGVLATYYTIDSGAQQTYNGAFSVSAPGSHSIAYWSVDAAGNPETAKPATSTSTPRRRRWATTPTRLARQRRDGEPHADRPRRLGRRQDAVRAQGSSTWLDTAANTFVVPAPADGSGDGAQHYQYQALDNAGNVSATGSCTVKIDTTAPSTSQTGADAAWHNAPVTVNFTASDASSGVARTEYTSDGSAWTTGASVTVPAPAGGGNDGLHAIQYRSLDNAGNVEATKSCTVKIDTTAPATTQSGADLAWHSSPITVTFAATDAGCGVAHTEYSLDGGAWTTGTSVTVAAPSDGTNDGVHTIDYRSLDNLGNTEDAQGCTVQIDTQQPVTVDNAGSSWHAVPFTLELSASGLSGTSTQYSIGDDQHWQAGTSVPFTAAWKRGGGSGTTIVYYRSVNGAGLHRGREELHRVDRHLAALEQRRRPQGRPGKRRHRAPHLPRHLLGARSDLVRRRRRPLAERHRGARAGAGRPRKRRPPHDPLLLDRRRRQRRGRLQGLRGAHRDALRRARAPATPRSAASGAPGRARPSHPALA